MNFVYRKSYIVYSLTVATVVATVFGFGLFVLPVQATSIFDQASSPHLAQLSILDTVASSSGLSDGQDELDQTTFSSLVGRIIRPLLGIFGSIFFALVIYAGVMWMFAAGNQERIASAKRILFTATVGLLLLVVSYGAVYFIASTISDSVGVQSEQATST